MVGVRTLNHTQLRVRPRIRIHGKHTHSVADSPIYAFQSILEGKVPVGRDISSLVCYKYYSYLVIMLYRLLRWSQIVTTSAISAVVNWGMKS
jgi:hypothetical protein